jgi:hypothetical protein
MTPISRGSRCAGPVLIARATRHPHLAAPDNAAATTNTDARAHMTHTEERRFLTRRIERTLARTPLPLWSGFAILVDSEDSTAQLMARGELVSWLRANDLDALARDAAARTVRDGAILTLTLGANGPTFRVLFDRQQARAPR